MCQEGRAKEPPAPCGILKEVRLMTFKSVCSGVAAVMMASVLAVGCGDDKVATRAEQAASRAEDAARRAESAAGRVEAAAQRAEAAAEKAERMFSKHLRK